MKRTTPTLVWMLIIGLLIIPPVIGIAVLAWWPNQASAAGSLLSGVAAAEVAILTVVLLVLNRDLVRANQQIAEATHAEAEATREEAAATRLQAEMTARSVDELRADRELQWAPQLIRTGRTRPGDARQPGDVTIRNIGRAPALRCLYVECYPDWQWTGYGTFDVPPEGQITVSTQLCSDPPGIDALAGPNPAGFGEILICQNTFGQFHRFAFHRPRASDKWRSDDPVPDWMTWYERVTRIDV